MRISNITLRAVIASMVLIVISLSNQNVALASHLGATLKVKPTNTGYCPVYIKFYGKIFLTGGQSKNILPKPIKYQFIRSDGVAEPVRTAYMNSNGVIYVNNTWRIGNAGLTHFSGWQKIRIVYPHRKRQPESNIAKFRMKCKPRPRTGIKHGLVARLYPDITSISGMWFSGRHVAWGKTIHLYQKGAWRYGSGKCVFYATYEIKNAGNGRVHSYIMNHMYEDSKLIARNYGTLTLEPGESKKINPAVGLRPGSHTIRVILDKNNNIVESNESNNTFSVRTILHGTCRKGDSNPPNRPRPELPQGDGRHAK